MSSAVLQKYGVFSSAFQSEDEKKLPVSEVQIKTSIKNAYKQKNNKVPSQIVLKPGNIAEVTINGGKETIKYYTNRQRNENTPPWFGVSEKTLTNLKNKHPKIEKYLLLFWEKQASGGKAPTFSSFGDIEDISTQWIKSETKDGYNRYLLNFQLQKENGKYISDNEINLCQHECGTSMGKDVE